MSYPENPIAPPPELVPIVRPGIDDVAALLRARTKDDNMNEVGAFTSDTRPTDVQVQQLIALAEGDVYAQVGTKLYASLAQEATAMIALRAACLVESSYFPEQIRTNRSAWDELWRMYEAGMTNLRDAVESGAGADGGAVDSFTYGTIPVRSWTTTAIFEFPADPA